MSMRDRPRSEWPTFSVTGKVRTLRAVHDVSWVMRAPDREYAIGEVGSRACKEYADEGLPVFTDERAEQV